MPELSTQVLLDGLLAFIALLFVPFGLRRGAAREGLVSAGIFLGGALARAWSETGGDWLSLRLGVDPASAGFAVALAALLGGTFLLGYGAAGVVAAGRPGVSGRLAGGLLAVFNGALFLSYLLGFIETYLRPGPGLDDGLVAYVLLRQTDQLLLVAAAALLVCVLIGWLTRGARRERVEPAALTPVRSRPVRVADEADAGKFEPAAPVRATPVLQETAPLPADSIAGPWRPSGPANGHGPLPGDAAWRDGATVANAAAPGGAWTNWGSAGDPARRFAAPSGDTGPSRRCPTCGALAGPNDVYCPQCGKSM